MTAPGLPPEVLSTVGLRPGMRVRDGSSVQAAEHVVAGVERRGGCWTVRFADTPELAVVGARHGWVRRPVGGAR